MLQCVLNDIERFDNNSNMLKVLFELIMKMTIQSVMPLLTTKLYEELQLLKLLCKRISLSEYTQRPSQRKDIYAYINKFIITLYTITQQEPKPETETIQKLLPKQVPIWTALVKATQQD